MCRLSRSSSSYNHWSQEHKTKKSKFHSYWFPKPLQSRPKKPTKSKSSSSQISQATISSTCCWFTFQTKLSLNKYTCEDKHMSGSYQSGFTNHLIGGRLLSLRRTTKRRLRFWTRLLWSLELNRASFYNTWETKSRLALNIDLKLNKTELGR